jgi:DNA-binding CsgD family transcriptional regulator
LKYKEQRKSLHLLVAGGRKAMSIYATLAASLLFTQQDKVWTILSPEVLTQHKGIFHAPAQFRNQIQMVQLPIMTTRILPGSIPSYLLENPENLSGRSRRVMFIDKLTLQERRLAETVLMNPYVDNQELANLLGKSKRTVETQFRSIYNKLKIFLDFGEEISNKRQALLDILSEE